MTDSMTTNGWTDGSSSVSIPEPHVPLRKASPHRLQPRKGHHPLLYTGGRGVEPFRPGIGSTTASPDLTAAVVKPRSSPKPDDVFDQTRKPSTDTYRPFPLATGNMDGAGKVDDNAWFRWDTKENTPPSVGRAPGLRYSRSISEGMRGLRERLAWQYENDSTDHPLPDPSWEEVPPINTDGVRSSYRSILTSNSSHLDSYASTDRSSMATGYSSTSDFVKVHPASPPMPRDDTFSVEDAIGMYADGFETPSKRSIDVRQSPERASPGGSHARPIKLHRRSKSAVLPEGFNPFQTGQPTLAPPKPFVQTPDDEAPDLEPTTPTPSSPPKLIPFAGNERFSAPAARDRYGFKKASHHVTVEEFDSWEAPYNEHLARRKSKWQAMMRQFGLATEEPTRFPPKSEKIKRYIRKGIPPEWRGAAWFWYAGGPGLQKTHEGLYFTLLQRINHDDALKEIDREHIERDLNRTFPDNLKFKPEQTPSTSQHASTEESDYSIDGPETPIIGSLRRVLQAFAVHRPSIGYCQSLNFIAGLLLLFLDSDEEKAFLLLDVITSDFLPGTHGVSLEGANIDIAVLMSSLKELMPAVWAKLDDKPPTPAPNKSSEGPLRQNSFSSTSLQLPTVSLATTPWFLTLYLTTLPMESALRIWDVLFFEGSKTLFRAALAIFKLAEDKIKVVGDPMEVFQIVQTLPRGLLDANALMELCFRKRGGFGGLSQDTVERRREDIRRRVRGKGGPTRVMTEGVSPVDGASRKKSVGSATSGVGFRGRFRSRTKGAQG